VAGDPCELISALEHEWRDALCAKDLGRLRLLIHPKFQLIGTRSTGPFTMTREEWLDAIQKRDPLSIQLKVADAVVLDKVMVGTIHARWQLQYLGRPIEDCVLLSDVWIFDDDRWQVVRRHSTPSPPEACAARGN
jgi:hypothetical protein